MILFQPVKEDILHYALNIHGHAPFSLSDICGSGFAGLIYESIRTHYFKLFLGHAACAQSLALAIFMGGMAI